MLEFISAALMYQVYDPAVWIAFAVGGALGRTRTGVGIGFIVVMAVATFGWLAVIQYQFDMNNTTPPLSLVAVYFLGKLLAFAFGIALNRLILRIEKRATRVLEKAGT